MSSKEQSFACLCIKDFALQCVLRLHPEWEKAAVVGVERKTAQASIVFSSAKARRLGIGPGMRLGEAQNLAARLHVVMMTEINLAHYTQELHQGLQTFSPRIETSVNHPGIFWLDPRGLCPLFGVLDVWGRAVLRALRSKKWHASLVIGFHPQRIKLIAQAQKGVKVFADVQSEKRVAWHIPLSVLSLDANLSERLKHLALYTLADFARLSYADVRRRLGEQAGSLYREYIEENRLPLQPQSIPRVYELRVEIDPPTDNCARLLLHVQSGLERLIKDLRQDLHRLQSLQLMLLPERVHLMSLQVLIEPATLTLDPQLVLELTHLKLSAVRLRDRVKEIKLRAQAARTVQAQLSLIDGDAERRREAGERAIARLRSYYGSHAAGRFTLRAAHAPEKKFAFEPLTSLDRIEARAAIAPERPRLVRWIVNKPLRLNQDFLRGATLHGPYRLSHGWWEGREEMRDYYYAEYLSGALRWVYFDKAEQGWFQHGEVA